MFVLVPHTDRVDFSDDTKKVTFEAGAMLSSFATIDIIDDRIMEENKTFICVILKSTRSEKDDLLTEDPNVATIAILDNDCKFHCIGVQCKVCSGIVNFIVFVNLKLM